ncbi:unnamed protein product [Arabidopsis halleri]
MDRISELPDELLVKIISFVPTKVAVSTSILSKRWESLWKWVPKLECDCSDPALRDFVLKNLPLRAPIIENLYLNFRHKSFQPEDIKLGVVTAVCHCLRELSINVCSRRQPYVVLSANLYTCKLLVTLNLQGSVLVDVPQMVCLPALKTLQLRCVTYSNQDSLQLLLSHCPVLEDLVIERELSNGVKDNVKAIVVIVSSLQRLSLKMDYGCSNDPYVIVTPSLKYFKVEDYRDTFSYSIEHMPKLEEADINGFQDIEKLLESVTSVKRLTLGAHYTSCEELKAYLYEMSHVQSVYRDGIVFDQLEQLKLCIYSDYWSTLLLWLLKNSPKLRVLNLYVDSDERYNEYYSVDWKKKRRSAPECLKKSLETLEFARYSGRQEERDFLSLILQNARCLKSSSISHFDHVNS